MYEFIVVGAGLAGSVLAERIANILGKKVLIIEKRNHIGGNCYDYYDKNGILVHKYGPHIFHTDSKKVWTYLSQFTEWNDYEHKVLGLIDGKKVPIPFNLNTLREFFPKIVFDKLKTKLIRKFGLNNKISILELRCSEDKDLKFLADIVYQKIFLNYTKKQWGLKPEDLKSSVTERVPIFISEDNRYFQDEYQGLPSEGYHQMFKKMLNNSNINIMLNTDIRKIIKIKDNEIFFNNKKFNGKLIFTGSIDELFNYCYGELPYRSLDFKFETLNINFFQEVGTVNFPNNHAFTRITEFKHLTLQKTDKTTIVREYPKVHDRKKNIPYYPIPKTTFENIYKKYLKKSERISNLILVGRLADYSYYDMDIVVDLSLTKFEELLNG